MSQRTRRRSGWFAACAASLLACAAVRGAPPDMAQTRAAWNQPATPFRVIGDVYYVGTDELASWLIRTPAGLILIDGAVTEVPAAVAAQLKSGTGRLMAILGGGPSARAVLGTATPGGVSVRAIFDCICPVLPAFAPAPAFAF